MKARALALIILLVGLVAGFFNAAEFTGFSDKWWARNFRLGLDLQGGTHLVYSADVSSIVPAEVGEAMSGLRDVIERRVNLFGVAEPVVQTESVRGDHRLIVELAGVFDIKDAIRLIGETPYLEFRELARGHDGNIIATSTTGITDFVSTDLTGRYLERAVLSFDPISGTPDVSIEFNKEGAEIFAVLTERNVGNPIAVFLDGLPISIPVVNEKIEGGRAQITGNFNIEEASQLVRRLNAGALPLPITLLSQQSVEPSLGLESLLRSLRASIYGAVAVMLFMILWYRLPGVVAVFSLGVYVSLALLLFKLIPITLSSAGIAGFILSIGLAVDANILIFERMKEELRSGRSLGAAIDEGFRRAWTSIRDANVSSLITASILYWFGTSLVRGFALTLGIGILVSMFAALYASRYFLKAIIPHTSESKFVRFLFGSGFWR